MGSDKRKQEPTSLENKRQKLKAPGKEIVSRPNRETGDGNEKELLLCAEEAPLGSREENEADDFKESGFDVLEPAIESTYEDLTDAMNSGGEGRQCEDRGRGCEDEGSPYSKTLDYTGSLEHDSVT